MAARRIQYQIDFNHIITFKEEYKAAVAPYFGFENLEYAIEAEGSIHEGIRLIFKNENIAFFLRKEALTFIFEGDVEDLKNQNGILKVFFELFEKVKSFSGYTKTIRHCLISHYVVIREKEEIEKILKVNPYLNLNPFGALREFSCLYEFESDSLLYKIQFGNYTNRDIKIHDLTPFKYSKNEDLVDNVGLMARVEIIDIEKIPTFGKFKSLISKSDSSIEKLNF